MHKFLRARAGHGDFAHVGNVEQARGFSHMRVFLENAIVLRWQRPAAEIHHAPPEGNVLFI